MLIIKVFILKIVNERIIILVGYVLGFISLIGFYFIDILQLKVFFSILFGLSVPGFFMFTLSMAVGHFKDNTGTVSSTIFSSGYLGIVFYQIISGYISETYSPDLLYVVIIASFLVLVVTVVVLNIGFREEKI